MQDVEGAELLVTCEREGRLLAELQSLRNPHTAQGHDTMKHRVQAPDDQHPAPQAAELLVTQDVEDRLIMQDIVVGLPPTMQEAMAAGLQKLMPPGIQYRDLVHRAQFANSPEELFAPMRR